MKSYKTSTSALTDTLLTRRLKSDPLIEAYGSIDELTAWLSYIMDELSSISREQLTSTEKLDTELEVLEELISSLSQSMAILAGEGRYTCDEAKLKVLVDKLIMMVRQNYPANLRGFKLRFKGRVANLYNIARTVCRRAERKLVEYVQHVESQNHFLIVHELINRLSDWLFVMALTWDEHTNRFKEL